MYISQDNPTFKVFAAAQQPAEALHNNAEQAVWDYKYKRSAEDSFAHRRYWSPSVVTSEHFIFDTDHCIHIFHERVKNWTILWWVLITHSPIL